MAAETTSASDGDRRILVVALALLGGVTGIVFGRVFLGTHPALRLAAVGILATLIAALLARRHLALSLAGSAVGLLLAVGIFVFPRTTWLGLPGPRTFEAIVNAFRVVTDRAATEIAPAPPLASLMTASVVAVWSACTAAHALAIRSGSSLLPLLPAAALLGFAGVVTEEPPRPGYVILFLGAAFAVLFAEAMQRASAWGRGSQPTVFSGRWARVIGGGAAALAVAIPAVLPGFGDKGMLDLEGGAERIGVTPIVDIRPSLLRNPVADLFSVRARRPSYWRMVVLDHFDGRLWTPSETEEAGLQPLSPGLDLLQPAGTPRGRLLNQEVEIHELATSWLPAAADPVAISLEDDLGATHDVRTNVLALESETSEGMRYDLTSAQAWPRLKTLQELIPNNPMGDPRYTFLPPQTPDRIRQIALDLAGRADTTFRAVLAIQNYLRSFTYDETAPAGHGTDDMLHFLEVSRRGYCEQFAGAMAVLVRSLGIPARVSIGFLPGERDETGRFRVTTAQVHAWPEVYFGEYGWLAFEPTPGRSNPSAGYLLPPSLRARGDQGAGNPAQNLGSMSAIERRQSLLRGDTYVQPTGQVVESTRREPFSWRLLVLIAVMAGAVLILLLAMARVARRRLVLRRGGDARHRILAAYAWLLDGAANLRIGRRLGETPLEYGSRLRGELGTSAPALGRLTALAEQALYSSEPSGREHAEEAVASTRAILGELRRKAGPWRTLVGALRPTAVQT